MTFKVSKLTARYSRIEVCHDVSFEVANGEFLAILGANGAGKSSLLGAIAGTVSGKGSILLGDDASTFCHRTNAPGPGSHSSPRDGATCSGR